jgi:hypothetical protein
MLHGGLPTHSGDMLAQLHEFVSTNEMQLDASSCIFTAGMVAGGLHNALHHDNPSMQWPFQQYSGSVHWLRRLRAGIATAADKALLEGSTYSRLYPAGLSSDWEQVRPHHPFHPQETWTCPAPLYPSGDIFEILQGFPAPDLSITMVVGWEERPEYDADGHLHAVDLNVQVVDIDHPAGPACDGCEPYTLTGEEGDVDACSSLWEQAGEAACGGGDSSDSGRPQYVTDYYPDYHAHEPPPWKDRLSAADEWSAAEQAVVVTALCTALVSLVWWGQNLLLGRRPAFATTRSKALRARQRQEQQGTYPRVSKLLWLPRLVLSWTETHPAGRVVLFMGLSNAVLRFISMQWPCKAAAALVGWSRVQQALHPVVAGCLGNGVITSMYWLCMWSQGRGEEVPLLLLLCGTVVAQAGLHWWDGSGWAPQQGAGITHLVWSWFLVSAGVIAVVEVIMQVLETASPAPKTQHHHQQQQQQSTASKWLWLPRQILSWSDPYLQLIRWAAYGVPGGWIVLSMLLFEIVVHPIELFWPSGTAALLAWWGQVQQAVHPVVANSLGSAAFSLAFWFVTKAENPGLFSSLHWVLLGVVAWNGCWHWWTGGVSTKHAVLRGLTGPLWGWLRVCLCAHGIVMLTKHLLRGASQAVNQQQQQRPLRRGATASSSSSGGRQRRAVGPRHTTPSTTTAAASQQAPVAGGRATGAHGQVGPGAQGTRDSGATHQQRPFPVTAAAAGVQNSSSTTTATATYPTGHHHTQQQYAAAPAGEGTPTTSNHHTTTTSSTSLAYHTTSISSSTCRVCGVARGPGVKLFKCSKCGGSADRYCSGVCFKVDWPRHKITCRAGVSPGK